MAPILDLVILPSTESNGAHYTGSDYQVYAGSSVYKVKSKDLLPPVPCLVSSHLFSQSHNPRPYRPVLVYYLVLVTEAVNTIYLLLRKILDQKFKTIAKTCSPDRHLACNTDSTGGSGLMDANVFENRLDFRKLRR
ncbi:hypothetical protein BGZ96_008564 [Linnemannia gamsii]|uniref:Uncharacterized protein n=1 Tax=Linnemannia gamsii TaxID=64522 RepID=A0ABQ7JZ03_9FUNG|nr:hypothetical protein BGZ96_008564 [Linnemannia gamsii]